jgi:predicted helicase
MSIWRQRVNTGRSRASVSWTRFGSRKNNTGGGVQGELDAISEENSARIRNQRRQPIFVCIGNPPYNAGQLNENDNNKNAKYRKLDARVSDTYGADSRATLLRKLADPYVKAIRWATDRIGDAGIVAFVNNNSFVDEISFDGMRHHLAQDFDLIYVLDLGGNVRKNPKLSGTTHNVFGIQVGVSINFFIRLPGKAKNARRQGKILYHAVPIDWRKEEKYHFLEKAGTITGIKWKKLKPDEKNTWLTSDTGAEFAAFTPMGSKEAKAGAGSKLPVIFRTYSLGVSTNRDSVAYDFDNERLAQRVEKFCDNYNAELHRWQQKGRPKDIDNFVDYTKLKWSRNLKRWFTREFSIDFEPEAIRTAIYRPFTKRNLYFARKVIDEIGDMPNFFPNRPTEQENRAIYSCNHGQIPFTPLMVARICDAGLAGRAGQSFPFYTYNEDGTNRQENIPLSTLVQFQSHYGDESITKWNIFHYIYAMLHHPGYRKRFAANLKRELPRIPFAAEFRVFAKAGKKLAELHVGYEESDEFSLERIERRDVPLSWRVEKMKLTADKRGLVYNDFLTLQGIPPEVFDYRLGNRSALEWVIDQYQVSMDTSSEIESDPNRPDDEQYIVRLIGKVIHVSLETLKIVSALPADFGAEGEQTENDHELETWRLNQRLPTSASARLQRERLRKQVESRT